MESMLQLVLLLEAFKKHLLADFGAAVMWSSRHLVGDIAINGS